jgi:exonuclease SbcC
MHLTSLHLRNFRVYRELDLEFPDGLIGIYGPNGAGKSTLVESLNYAIYGESRTPKDELRSEGVGDDLRVTLTFEHEGNAYEVRRALKGVNLTPQVQVFRNGQLAVSSAREANAWLAQVVGMTAQAFQASVCAQQKELTAFATMQGAERRRLVLDLLGVSPVERALRKVREAARDAGNEATGARQALVPVDGLEQAAAEAEAELAAARTAAEAAAEAEAAALAELAERREQVAAAEQAAKALDELRAEARLARADAEQRRAQAASHEARALAADRLVPLLQAAQARAAELPVAAAALETLDAARAADAERAGLAKAVREAAGRLTTAERVLAEAEQAAGPAERLAGALAAADDAATAAEQALVEARERYGGASAELAVAGKRLEGAQAAVEGAGALDRAAPCPTCGQALGDAFEAVRAHREAELAAATAEAERLGAAVAGLEAAGNERRAERDRLVAARDTARREHDRARHAAVRAEAAAAARATAAADLAAAEQALAAVPDPAYDPEAHRAARAAVEAARSAATEAAEHRAGVARADEERALAKDALTKADEAEGRADGLTGRAQAMAHLDTELSAARAAEQAAGVAATGAHGAGRAAAEALRGAERRQADRAAELARARAAHERVAVLDEQAAYLERTSDLVKGFRLHLVSRLGARLSAEAARLFAELTDHEYADLEIDPEDYSIRIVDGGVAHELSRYSGSENDLASLSLRVAISLVIAEGTRELGLLVLDEVLGSLDRDRRERMLAALTSLQGRFRQVLLVTHNEEVKDLLPAAIEVRRGQHRTSTARLAG